MIKNILLLVLLCMGISLHGEVYTPVDQSTEALAKVDADIFHYSSINVIIKIDNEKLIFTVSPSHLEMFISHVLVWYLDNNDDIEYTIEYE